VAAPRQTARIRTTILHILCFTTSKGLVGAHISCVSCCREQVGVELEKDGSIKVDGQNQTTVPSIYAIGDVCTKLPLTPVARMEGTYLARRLFGYVYPTKNIIS